MTKCRYVMFFVLLMLSCQDTTRTETVKNNDASNAKDVISSKDSQIFVDTIFVQNDVNGKDLAVDSATDTLLDAGSDSKPQDSLEDNADIGDIDINDGQEISNVFWPDTNISDNKIPPALETKEDSKTVFNDSFDISQPNDVTQLDDTGDAPKNIDYVAINDVDSQGDSQIYMLDVFLGIDAPVDNLSDIGLLKDTAEILENIDSVFVINDTDVQNDVEIYSKDIFTTADIPNVILCGEIGVCNEGFICIDDMLCCPLSMPINCNGQCFPDSCLCVAEDDFTLCVPDNMDYCGNGISCLKGECYFTQDLDSHICISEDKYYCGNEVICLKDKETCYQDIDDYYCIPNDKIYCTKDLLCDKFKEDCYFADDLNKFECKPKGLIYCGEDIWCENWQVCPNCCPEIQPIKCGETCCYPNEKCVDPVNSICQPETAIWCNGILCAAGMVCADDGLAICYPKNGDYCGNGQSCPSATVCAGEGNEVTCCSQNTPQLCGHSCCPDYYICVDTVFGKECIPPNTIPCGNVFCIAGEYCEDEASSFCVKEGSEPCGNKFCYPGTYCKNGTCCAIFNVNKDCSELCCPSDWDCLKNVDIGKVCIPQGAEYIGNGQYCDKGKFYNKENGNCDPIGWKQCGTGPACAPDLECVKEGQNKQCCAPDQTVLCGDKCCSYNTQCIHDGAKSVCIQINAEYCWGNNTIEWCPPVMYCGKKKCIPDNAIECDNGDFCSAIEKCTNSSPPCCPLFAPIPCETNCCLPGYECKTFENGQKQCCQPDSIVCGNQCCSGNKYECKVFDNGQKQCCSKGAVVCENICCPIGYTCEEFNDIETCIPSNVDVCQNTIVGDTMCTISESFCESDGACVSNEFKNQQYNYCGGGKTCPTDQNCGGLCSDFCCEQQTKCNLSSCFLEGKVECNDSKDGNSVTCWGDAKNAIDKIKECTNGKCKNLNCEVKGSGMGIIQYQICCTYDKTKSVGCLAGCVTEGQLCQDIPTSNSIAAYFSPQESGLLPQNTPYEIGDECFDGFALGIPEIIGFGSVSAYFHPAGFAINYDPITGIYDINNDHNGDDLDLDNWVPIQGNPGDEILVIEIVWIWDNLEGNDCPHGPYAQLYILIHKKGKIPSNLDKVLWADLVGLMGKNYNKAKDKTVDGYNARFLKGPLQGKDSWEICVCAFEFLGICIGEKCWSSYGDNPDGTKDFDTDVKQEWIDNLSMKYTPGKAGIYPWGKDENEIYLSLRESDGEPDFGRYDDYMGLQKVTKGETKKSCGALVPLYKYENVKEDDNEDNDGDVDPNTGKPYYYKTGKIAALLRLRTIVVK